MTEVGSIKMWLLAFVVAAGGGFAALVGIGCLMGANACPFTDPKPITATDGKALFESQCIACHGRSGEGSVNAPALASGPLAALSLDTLTAKIGRGRPLAAMPAFKRILTAEQIDAVARYVLTLRGSP